MTKLATAYAYDEHGAYLGETNVQELEGRPGEYNMIPGCTLDPPPVTDNQHYPRWDGKGWVVERVLSQVERYVAGLDSVPDGMVVDGDDLRPMNRGELVAAGKLTQAEAERLDLLDEERSLQASIDELDRKAIRAIRAERTGAASDEDIRYLTANERQVQAFREKLRQVQKLLQMEDTHVV